MSYRSSPSYSVGGISYDPETQSFLIPPWGWRCFHCNEHFDSVNAARRHFGPTPVDTPACQTFEEAWAKKEAEGYQYGPDAMEQVRFGWEIAKGLA
jgi:hypothetical protein